MRLLTLFGLLLFSLATATAQAQVVGGYTTVAPAPAVAAPVVTAAPAAEPRQPVTVQPVQGETAPQVSSSGWRSVNAGEVRTAMRPSREIVRVNYESQPMVAALEPTVQTIEPIEMYEPTITRLESMRPVPVSLTGGVARAEYYAPSLSGQVVPVQGSAPVTVMQTSPVVGNCCTPCCTPVAQTTMMPAPAAAQVSPLPPGHQFGRGMLLQPVVYVQGQPLRNFFRFISP